MFYFGIILNNNAFNLLDMNTINERIKFVLKENYVRIMRTHADQAMRLILDNLK